MQDRRMVTVNHGESVPRHQNGMCLRCRCDDGEFRCSRPDDDEADCMRSDPQDNTRRNCMMNGERVMHNEQREVSSPKSKNCY